jgi:predicted phosphoribosyltransferase
MDVLLVHRLGLPGQAEVTMGAVTSGGTIVLNDDIVTPLEIPAETISEVANHEFASLEHREHLYRSGRPPLSVTGRTVLLVDDGLTTGTTMRAAVAAVRHKKPLRIVVAAPVASRAALGDLQADAVICVMVPEVFHALGFWYRDFEPVSDDTVQWLLEDVENLVHRGVSRPGTDR